MIMQFQRDLFKFPWKSQHESYYQGQLTLGRLSVTSLKDMSWKSFCAWTCPRRSQPMKILISIRSELDTFLALLWFWNKVKVTEPEAYGKSSVEVIIMLSLKEAALSAARKLKHPSVRYIWLNEHSLLSFTWTWINLHVSNNNFLYIFTHFQYNWMNGNKETNALKQRKTS